MSIRMGKAREYRGCTVSIVLPLAVIAFALSVSGMPQRIPKRKIACKTPENAAACYWTHGRLAEYNGTPSIRLWKIGTRRILAIHSGPGFKIGDNQENETPELPANVDRAFARSTYGRIFGDFEVCPLEPDVAGEMQDACIESGKNMVDDK